MKPIALVVDDEPHICELLSITLERMDIATRTCLDVTSAKQALGEQAFDLCLTDMRLPDGDGLELVEWIQREVPGTPVAVITAHGSVEAAVRALKLGAFDFVSKPLDLNDLRKLVTAALKLKGAAVPRNSATDGLVGQSPPLERVRAMVAKVARSQAPVHISGESGTGKELVARMIHETGPRREGPFVPINCGAIPTELMESEFFGHKKGSFTGAVGDKTGLIQTAEGGTLFLDEVADLPLHMQVKLLRVIQEKTIRPVGQANEVPVDVRILSATHKNLGELVAEGSFREDLYYRINVIGLQVPPLRDRGEDVLMLAHHALTRLAGRAGRADAAFDARGARRAARLPLPRQRARAREHPRARVDAVLRRGDRRRGPAVARGGSRRSGAAHRAPIPAAHRSARSSRRSSATRSSRRSSRRATTRRPRRNCSA